MGNPQAYDALIIGAGPAGSTAAYILASKGYRVLILDKKKFPRNKPCGGLLTWKTIKLLKAIFGAELLCLKSTGVIQYQSRRYLVASKQGNLVRGELDFPFHLVERKVYDQFWLNKAQDAGAEVRLGEKVAAIDPKAFKLTTRGGEFYGRFILGADGIASRVRATLIKNGLIKNANRWPNGLAAALEAFIPRRDDYSFTDYPIIYFGYIPWGYAWSFPGNDHQIIGMCGLSVKSGKQLRACFDEFLGAQKIPQDATLSLRHHPLPYGNYLDQPGQANILLLGDACGLADPLLGEGIYYAHKSAQLAAQAVMQSQSNPVSALENYRNSLHRSLIVELKFARISRFLIYTFLRPWNYKGLGLILRGMQKKIEETIQGQRSFKGLRRIAN
ncbi:MAG: geranylgeranyl reductase family protein [Desulfobacterales bacterium]|nr:MAG: geranylgeranyl reductase family protein [Desulfobacterales bacterium]